MFRHEHPYDPFIPPNTQKLIVGTLPPPRFSAGELKPGDVDFPYGSRDGLLWPILNELFDLDLEFENTDKAIVERKEFLISRHIGICDIVKEAYRARIDASDLGMQDIVLRDLVSVLQQHPEVDTLLFTGGNSKNGPEYFFRKLLKVYGLRLQVIQNTIPRVHFFLLPGSNRKLKTVSLTAPSGSANRAIGSIPEYKERKQFDTSYSPFHFRVEQYAKFF